MAATVIDLNEARRVRSRVSEPYELDKTFEAILVEMCCSNMKFYTRIGVHLVPECMPTPTAQLVMIALKAVIEDLGVPLGSCALVLQRLHQMRRKGSVSHEQIIAVMDLFEVGAREQVDPEVMVKMVVPILKRRAQLEAVISATDRFGKHEELSDVAGMILKADQIGAMQPVGAIFLGKQTLQILAQMQKSEMLEIGIPDLDEALAGEYMHKGNLGLCVGTETVFIGDSGSGKSMALIQCAASAARQGMFAAYATLELSVVNVHARLLAHLTGFSIKGILSDDIVRAKAGAALAAQPLGPIAVQYFTPQATTVEDLEAWIKDLGKEHGSEPRVLIVDYADKLVSKLKRKNGDEVSKYTHGQIVFETLRLNADEKQRWCITAAQAKRKDRHRSMVDLEDAADSIEKVRVADYVFTLNSIGDGQHELVIFIAKNRHGSGRYKIGPCLTDFARGRLVEWPPKR